MRKDTATGGVRSSATGEVGLRRYVFISLALHGLFLLASAFFIISEAPPVGSPDGKFFHGKFEEPVAQPLPPPSFDRTPDTDFSLAKVGEGIQDFPEDSGVVVGGVTVAPMANSLPHGTVSLLGMSVRGESVVFLLDGSGSMLEKVGQERRYDAAIAQILEAVRNLSPSQRFNIVVFGIRPVSLAAEPIIPVAENIERAEKFLRSNPNCGGATDLETAFVKVFHMNPDAIVLFTDGEPNESPSITLAQIHYLRKKISPTAQIYAVGMQRRNEITAEIFLRKLSSQNGGDYIHWVSSTEVALSPAKPRSDLKQLK